MPTLIAEVVDAALGEVYATLNLKDASVADLMRAARRRIGSVTNTKLTVPDASERPQNTLSGRYGNAAFPHHTDFAFCPLPPRLIILINQSHKGFERPTTVCRIRSIDKDIGRPHARSLWVLRRRSGCFTIAGRMKIGCEFVHRWDRDSLQPCRPIAGQLLTTFPEALRSTEIIHEAESKLGIVD